MTELLLTCLGTFQENSCSQESSEPLQMNEDENCSDLSNKAHLTQCNSYLF